jgi:DNA primase
VVLALDSDRAGIAAVKRAAELMLARGIDLKVARLHGGKDPADLVAEDPALLKRDIKDAKHVIEFLLDVLKEEAGDARKFKVRARDEILPYLLQIESHIERDHFVEVVAQAIDSNIESVRLELARLEAAKVSAGEKRLREPEPTATRPAPVNIGRKQALMNFLAVLEELLTPSEGHMLAERFIAIVGQSPKEIRDDLPSATRSELVFKLEDRLSTMQTRHIREEWESGLRELESLLTKEKITLAKQELATAEDGGNETEAARILNIIDELKGRI